MSVQWLTMKRHRKRLSPFEMSLPYNLTEPVKNSWIQSYRDLAPFAAALAELTAMGASVDVFTLWHQQAIRVKEPVEQRSSGPALGSRVTPVANETLADLGLCGCVD